MITIREYARITSNQKDKPSMDLAVVDQITIDWLVSEHQGGLEQPDAILKDKHSLRLGSLVGYLESPSGECIEILPKISSNSPDDEEKQELRKLLQKMLSATLKLNAKQAGAAHLQTTHVPIHEWIINCFLNQTCTLIKKGIRRQYLEVEEESTFLRGRLIIARQLRQPPNKATIFQVRHDDFSANRIENRLIKTAVAFAFKVTKNPVNWRLANELTRQLDEIKPLHQADKYFGKWQSGRLMKDYDPVRPWCELIINKLNPSFIQGKRKGIALLYPMERLFESYVESCLGQQLTTGSKLKRQASSKYMLYTKANDVVGVKNWFQLKPDLMLINNSSKAILDAKWKMLEEGKNNTKDKFGISQSDIYQMYAYGQKYLQGDGHIFLIYPFHKNFPNDVPPFYFDDELQLWIVGFDLDSGHIMAGEHSPILNGYLVNPSLVIDGI